MNQAPIRSFRDLDAWKVAMELAIASYAVTVHLPGWERFALGAQIRRAAVSIPSNIAEGQASGPGRRYANHVRIALGSVGELATLFELVRRVGFQVPELAAAEEQLVRTAQLLHGLARSLRKRRNAIGLNVS